MTDTPLTIFKVNDNSWRRSGVPIVNGEHILHSSQHITLLLSITWLWTDNNLQKEQKDVLGKDKLVDYNGKTRMVLRFLQGKFRIILAYFEQSRLYITYADIEQSFMFYSTSLSPCKLTVFIWICYDVYLSHKFVYLCHLSSR